MMGELCLIRKKNLLPYSRSLYVVWASKFCFYYYYYSVIFSIIDNVCIFFSLAYSYKEDSTQDFEPKFVICSPLSLWCIHLKLLCYTTYDTKRPVMWSIVIPDWWTFVLQSKRYSALALCKPEWAEDDEEFLS